MSTLLHAIMVVAGVWVILILSVLVLLCAIAYALMGPVLSKMVTKVVIHLAMHMVAPTICWIAKKIATITIKGVKGLGRLCEALFVLGQRGTHHLAAKFSGNSENK